MSEVMGQKQGSGGTRKPRASKLSTGIIGLGVLAATALTGLAGCDTVARISFQDNEFSGVRSVGLVAPGGSCKGSEGAALIRLVPQSSLGAVHEGMVLGTTEVEFTRDSLEFTDLALFSMPNETCSGTCEQDGFACGFSNTSFSNEPELERCHIPNSGVSVTGTPKFVSKLNGPGQLFGLLMENTGSLEGMLPDTVTNGVYPDYLDMSGGPNPDGIGDNNIALQSHNGLRATDPRGNRRSALSELVRKWELVADYAQRQFKVRTSFGLWTFANSRASITSLVGTDLQWTTSPMAADQAISKYPSQTSRTQASVFESISTLLTSEDAYAGTKYDGYEKVLVVFVDGPDELRLPNLNAQRVIDEAAGAGDVRIFIVHLDEAVKTVDPMSKTPTFVDDPVYVASQDGFASESDCDCKGFEECRQVTRYADALGTTADFLPGGDKNDKFFCVPSRDENGRIGPIDDYAEIACATGGGYIYVPEGDALGSHMNWLPEVLDGLWEVPVNVDAFSRGSVDRGQPYQVQMNMNLTLGGKSQPFTFSQKGSFNNSDTRAVVFAAE